jgi:hypothetical protein
MKISTLFPKFRKAIFFSAIAVLLFCALPTSMQATNPPANEKHENTLLTGVVVSKGDYLIRSPIPVRIYRNGGRVAEVFPENGMFVFDLKGMADRNDLIEVVIWPERIDRHNHHSGKTIRTDLAHAQNLNLEIAYSCPPRRGIRTLYINNI